MDTAPEPPKAVEEFVHRAKRLACGAERHIPSWLRPGDPESRLPVLAADPVGSAPAGGAGPAQSRATDLVHASRQGRDLVAFSPTDTMPLARWAKMMMTVQAMVALSTAGLVIARAVNVLG